jgi:phospholipid transport system transporter-binding protein
VSAPDPDVTIAAPGRVSVGGALTFESARRAYDAGVACFVSDGSAMIAVDCAQVTHADSAGLAVLVEWRRWCRQHGRHLKFVNLPEQINALARLSEISAVLADEAA